MKRLIFLLFLISTINSYAASEATLQTANGQAVGTAANPLFVTNASGSSFAGWTLTGNSTTTPNNVGIGTNGTLNTLDVSGNAAIGTGYANIDVAPSSGLIVQGNLGVGTFSPLDTVGITSPTTKGGIIINGPPPPAYGVFNGTSAYLEIPFSLLNFGASSFTIEARVNFSALPTNGNVMIIAEGTSTGGFNGFQLAILNTTGTYSILARGFDGAGGAIGQINGNITTPVIGTTYEIAWVRNGSSFNAYFNGTSVGNASTATSFSNLATNVGIGAAVMNGAVTGSYLAGSMADVRISNDARYTTTYVPATSPFTNDANTLMLFHLNNNITDSSSNAVTAINHNITFASASPLFPTGSPGINLGGVANVWVDGQNGNTFKIDTSGSTAMAINSAGNVGIGTMYQTIAIPQILTVSTPSGSGIVIQGQRSDIQTDLFQITQVGGATATSILKINNNNALGISANETQLGTYVSQSVPALPTAGSLIMPGNLGIGTFSPQNQLSVNGGVGIGTGQNSSYINTIAPFGGLIVQGNVGIGSVTPGNLLDIFGTVRITGGGGTYASGNNIGVSGTGATSCLCKTFTGGICTVIGTCT